MQICSKLAIILTFSRKCLFYRIFTLPIFTLPFHILKRCDKSSIRRWFSVVSAYKATLYSLYYRKATYDRYGTSIYRKNKSLRAQNFRKNQQMPKISDQKTQILIKNAFMKLYNIESISQDQAVEIRLNNKNFDSLPSPTT